MVSEIEQFGLCMYTLIRILWLDFDLEKSISDMLDDHVC